MTVSRRPKRAASAAVLGVLLTNFPSWHQVSVFPRSRAFSPRQATGFMSVLLLFRSTTSIWMLSLRSLRRGAVFGSPLDHHALSSYKSHSANRVLLCFHSSSYEHLSQLFLSFRSQSSSTKPLLSLPSFLLLQAFLCLPVLCGLCQPWRLAPDRSDLMTKRIRPMPAPT